MKSSEEWLREAEEMPDGDVKMALLEEAMQAADEEQNLNQAYEVREEYIRCASFQGYPMKMLVAFSWVITKWEQHPGQFPEYSVLWMYKWVLGAVRFFPQISLEKINQLFEDMKKKYTDHGGSLRSYYFYRMSFAKANGFETEIEPNYEGWQATGRGYLSCCRACEVARESSHLSYLGEHKKAIRKAKTLLTGQLQCTTEPQSTYSKIIRAFEAVGNESKAMEFAQKAYRMTARKRGDLENNILIMRFMLKHDLAKSKTMFEQHLHFAMDTENPYIRFHYYLFAITLMSALHGRKFQLKLPRRLPLFQDSGKYDFAALREWFTAEAKKIAEAFDQRNGNDHFMKQIESSKHE